MVRAPLRQAGRIAGAAGPLAARAARERGPSAHASRSGAVGTGVARAGDPLESPRGGVLAGTGGGPVLMLLCGIDPGLCGAVALLDPTGTVVPLYHVPTLP